jgi:hypothetical protein
LNLSDILNLSDMIKWTSMFCIEKNMIIPSKHKISKTNQTLHAWCCLIDLLLTDSKQYDPKAQRAKQMGIMGMGLGLVTYGQSIKYHSSNLQVYSGVGKAKKFILC